MLGFMQQDNEPNRFISGRQESLITGDDNQWLSEHVYLDDNDVPRCSPDFNILEHLDEVQIILANYDEYLRGIYHDKMRYYKGDHRSIRERLAYRQLDDNQNRVVINTAKNLVNTFNGFFIGIPPKILYAPNKALNANSTEVDKYNELISQTLADSDSDDVFYELAKKADIYGRSYLVAYISADDDKTLKFTHKSPENALVVYTNSNDSDQSFGMTFENISGKWFGTLYTDEVMIKFTSDDFYNAGGFEASVKWNKTITKNPIGIEPITEMPENDERLGLIDDLVSVLDSQDKVMSQKIDENDYFNNAILLTKGVEDFTNEQRATAKHWHMLQVKNLDGQNAEVEYLQKPDADQLQEHSIAHLKEAAYNGAQVVNLDDPDVSAATSGFALTQRMQPMQMLSSTKGEKMRKTIRRLLWIIFSYAGKVKDLKKINELVRSTQVEFTANIPHSEVDESTIVKNLNGIVPTPILYGYLSRIKNVNDAVKMMEDEKAKNAESFGGDGGGTPPDDGDYPPDEPVPPKPDKPKPKDEGGDD